MRCHFLNAVMLEFVCICYQPANYNVPVADGGDNLGTWNLCSIPTNNLLFIKFLLGFWAMVAKVLIVRNSTLVIHLKHILYLIGAVHYKAQMSLPDANLWLNADKVFLHGSSAASLDSGFSLQKALLISFSLNGVGTNRLLILLPPILPPLPLPLYPSCACKPARLWRSPHSAQLELSTERSRPYDMCKSFDYKIIRS